MKLASLSLKDSRAARTSAAAAIRSASSREHAAGLIRLPRTNISPALKPFAKVGFSGDFGGTWLLQRLVGPLKAKELYFLSDVISAQQALELGLVTTVVPHDSLMDETMALAERLAAGPTMAYGRIKDNFTFGATASFSDTLTREAENMIASGKTADHQNAARAFVEKREPSFEGR